MMEEGFISALLLQNFPNWTWDVMKTQRLS